MPKRIRLLLPLFAICLLSQAQTPPVLQLYPVDDTSRDSSFRAYIGKLRSAVKGRKVEALRKLTAEDVFVGPGDKDKGWEKFMAAWHPDDRENTALWLALSDLISLGAIREHPSLFLSPYLVWRFPRNLAVDTHLVVIRDKVALRETPAMNGRTVASLSFDIVLRLDPVEGQESLVQWVHVRTFDGKSGYLTSRDVMSPVMPRAQFGLRHGRWLLVALEGAD
ncbi:MAG: hypothetical protein ABI693_16735 [Bryobacteraceae bacterium]